MLTVPHITDLGIRKIPLTDVLFPSFFFLPIHTVGTILDPRRRSRLCLFSPIPRPNFSIQSVCILPSHIPFTCDCFAKTLPETNQNLHSPPKTRNLILTSLSSFSPSPPMMIRFLQMSGMTAGAIIDADRRLIAHEKLMRNRKKVARDAEVWRRYEEDYQLLLEEQATPTGTGTTPTPTSTTTGTTGTASTGTNKDAAPPPPSKNKKKEEEEE